MKKVVALLLIIVMVMGICSCGVFVNMHAVALADEAMEVNGYNDHYKDEGYKSFLAKIRAFSAKLTDKLCSEYAQSENTVISPLSVYMALALACECATGETRQEILDAVGVTYDEVSAYAKKLYGFANIDYSQLNMVGIEQTVAHQELFNSIWLDDSVSFKKDGVNKLASEYNCDVFQASFKNGEAGRLINGYIENKSHGLLKGDVSFSPETYFVLMNTYYLKEIWNELGDHLEFAGEKYDFYNTDGSVEKTKLLQGYYSAGKCYEGNGFTAFFTTTEHSFKIYFFVPNDELKASDIFTEQNISSVLNLKDWGHVDDEKRQVHYTRVLFPEFEADFSENIADVLSEGFGIDALFDPNRCDMSNVTDEPVFCEGVIHKATIKVDKTGIEGSAATILPMCGAAGPGEYEEVYHDFVVSRAFGFVLVDQYGTVVFSGIINTLD